MVILLQLKLNVDKEIADTYERTVDILKKMANEDSIEMVKISLNNTIIMSGLKKALEIMELTNQLTKEEREKILNDMEENDYYRFG